MKSIVRSGFAAIACVSMILGFTACGVDMNGDSAKSANSADSSKNTTSQENSAVPDVTSILDDIKTDDTLAAKLPDSIKSSKTLTIGSFMQQPPNNMYGADGKTPVGDEVDISKAIGKKLGVEVVRKDMSFDSLITSLQTGRVDATMAAMNDTKARQEKVDFVDYLTAGITMIVQKGNPKGIKGPDNLCGTATAASSGTSQAAWVKQVSSDCQAKGEEPIDITITQSDSQNQTQLQTGRIDFVALDLPAAIYISKTAGNGKLFEAVDYPPINAGPFGIGFNKKNTELRDAVQGALQSLIDDGTYMKILEAWGIQNGAIKSATVNAGE
ncbi:ABC transporter substrate-binding protein [Bifidobacterium callitrichos]|nr:ABC transporter substrate-binding protein [Bifidobacterium callitrichos]